MSDAEKLTLLMAVRQACFLVVDAVEHILHISPTTAEIRKQYKSK